MQGISDKTVVYAYTNTEEQTLKATIIHWSFNELHTKQQNFWKSYNTTWSMAGV